MKNFEVQHTVRLYDTELIAEIGRTYEARSKEFRNKNEFLTELLRLGVKAMNSFPPMPPAVFQELTEIIGKALEIAETSEKYLTTQFKALSIHLSVVESLLSSIYSMQLGNLTGEPPLLRKVEDGLYDDLPFRFQNLIVKLEKRFGLA